MKSFAASGIWPASLTPFAMDGTIDEVALSAHVGDLASVPGVTAVVVNGHAGETTALTFGERARVIRLARAAAPSSCAIVAGIVADDTAGAAALAADARAAGADALLVFPPLLFAQGANLRPAMAEAFLAAVDEAAKLPLVLFQLPLSSGLGFAPELLVSLCKKFERVVAVKEGSDSVPAYEDACAALGALESPVSVLTTNNSWLMASLSLGGQGILSGLGSVASPLLSELFSAMQASDLERARAVNARLRPLCRAFYRAPFLDAHNRMKTALHLMGKLPHPDPRPPLLPIDRQERESIRQALLSAGLLN
jgi:4-hydroxy-tetrahydrodipicolinate synthase